MSRKLLWVGDAVMKTGFAKVTHSVLKRLVTDWDVEVLGVNYHGDPNHGYPYPIWPPVTGGDMWGFARIAKIVKDIEPDVIIINSDAWIVADYLAKLHEAEIQVPVVAYMPVDMPGAISRKVATAISRLFEAIFYTEFGREAAVAAGLRCPTSVVPHGVDLDGLFPVDKVQARKEAGLYEVVGDAFVVGNVNRNQPRKRLDATIRAFVDWRRETKADAWLYLHCDANDVALDIVEVARGYGAGGRVIYPSIVDVPDEMMRNVYSSLDVHLTTQYGEGWGLTPMEALACGVPQIAPKWSALAEWMTAGAILVECTDHHVLAGKHNGHYVNGLGGVVDQEGVREALDQLYRDQKLRDELGIEGLELVSRPEYRWDSVAAKIGAVLERAAEKPNGATARFIDEGVLEGASA